MSSHGVEWYWQIIGKLVVEVAEKEEEVQHFQKRFHDAQREMKAMSERNGFQALTIAELKAKLEMGE